MVLPVKSPLKMTEEGWGGIEDLEYTTTCFGEASVLTCSSSGILY